MREMKDSGIEFVGRIPYTWKVYKNKYLFFSSKNNVGDNFDQYQLLSLTTKGVIEKDINSTDGKLPESFSTYQSVKVNDIVLCLFDLDVSAVFSGISNYDGMISSAYKIVSCNEKIIPKFADYWFKNIGHDRNYLLYSKSLRNTINADNFKEIPMISPSVAEQQKIVSYLDQKLSHIDNIIEKTKKSIEEYKKYKQSLITEVVTKGLDKNVKMKDSGVEWIGEIPEHWSIIKIKYFFDINKRIVGELGYDVLSVTQKGLKIKDIESNEGQISADYSKYQYVDIDDYVMNHMDLLTGWVDLSVFKGVTSPDYRVFTMKSNLTNSKDYYKIIFQMYYSNRIFYGMGQGVSDLGRWRLQTDKFNNAIIPLPPHNEQIEIAEFVNNKIEEINRFIDKKERFISELKSYKKSLIYEVVTGKKEIN